VTTANDLITDAIQKLGVYAPGETMTAADSAQGLTTLNDMVNQWGEEYLTVYTLTATTIPLVANQKSYTIGVVASPSINQQRPPRIETGPGAASISGAPVNVVSSVEWNAIEGTNTGFGTPDTLFYDPQYPNGVLNVAPTPDAIGSLIFQAWTPLRSFASLSLPSVIFAAGCEDALKTNLALALKSYFSPGAIDPALVVLAANSKQLLGYTNLTSRAMLRRGIKVMQPQAAGPRPA
jgi:hypothetical protein